MANFSPQAGRKTGEGPLRILILEDDPADAELMAAELRERMPYRGLRVANREDFVRALQDFRPDLILSDLLLPELNGMEALHLAKASCPEVPFIFVSGARGEEVAVEALKQGATDFILKDRLSGLAPAVTRALQAAEDRQQRRQAESALRESEERYRIVVESIPAVVYKGYLDYSVDFVDDKVEELTGYPKEEFNSRRLTWYDVLLPEDREKFRQDFKQALKTSGTFIRECRIRDKDGRVIWIQDRGQIIYTPDGQVDFVSGVFFDISDRVTAEAALRDSEQRLRYLSAQLFQAQERERKRISMELHDELGQGLSVVKLQVRAIERGLSPDQEKLRLECRELLQFLDEVIENVRRLSRDLSPAALEDLGLRSALKYLIDGVSRHYTVHHSFEDEQLNHRFAPEEQIIIYRIFQECLTNISKHAEATEVMVSVKEADDAVTFMLEDNGVGFEPHQVLNRHASGRGLGLTALDERVRQLGGSLTIWSEPQRGTRVTCTIPYSRGVSS